MKYSFGPESLISRVEIVRTETGAKRAYLESAQNADKAKLGEVREALAKHGYLTVPIEVGGKPLLEVRKFSSPESLLKQLGESGGVSGVPAQQMAVQDRMTAWQWVKNNTYKACLAFYLVGDAGYTVYGRYKNRNNEAKRLLDGGVKQAKKPFWHSDNFDEYAGNAYFLGTASSIASTMMRGDQSDEEVQKISEKLRDDLKDHHGGALSTTYKAIEENSQLHGFARVKQFIVKHPAEILNYCYALAGASIAYANRGHYKLLKPEYEASKKALEIAKASKDEARIAEAQSRFNTKKADRGVYIQDMTLGSITFFSGTSSSLIKERPRTPDEAPPQGIFAKAWRWIEEKPLRLAAGGYLISTVLHLNSTTKEYANIEKNRAEHPNSPEYGKVFDGQRKLTHFRMLFCVTNIIAEILMALSSKGHGEGVKSDATVETSATAIAAENIALQAPEKREELVEKFAEHLASPKVMGGSSVMIARGIRSNLKSLESNPWTDTGKTGHVDRVATQTAQHAVPAVG